MNLVELTGVQVTRGGRTLSDPIDLPLEAGSVLAVVGPNGVGKSSLLAAMARTGVDARGGIYVGGVNLARASARTRGRLLALLAQDSAGPEQLLVRELVTIGARAGGHGADRSTVTSALFAAGVGHLADRRMGTLSGGQRQLAQLARVIAQDTPLVILDEPAAALDLRHQLRVEQVVADLAARGRVVIAAVHDLGFALTAATHALLLTPAGRVHSGAPADVLSERAIGDAYGVSTARYTTTSGRTILVPTAEPATAGTSKGTP